MDSVGLLLRSVVSGFRSVAVSVLLVVFLVAVVAEGILVAAVETQVEGLVVVGHFNSDINRPGGGVGGGVINRLVAIWRAAVAAVGGITGR